MRKLLFTIFFFGLLNVTTGFAQTVIIDEGFDDGDFTNNPTWTDPDTKHIVNTSNLLQLDAPAVIDEAVISTPSDAAYGEWEALVQLDFNPSGSNLSRFYILSDTQGMKGDVDGYYIVIGDTQEEISLYRQDGSSSTKIIDGVDGLIDSDPVNVRVRATRDLNGNWELFADASGGSSFASQGTTTDNTYQSSEFIGFFSDYTSTRSDGFEYDEIVVTKVNPPLQIQDVTLQNNSTVDVSFNLDIDPASVDAADFSVDNGVGAPNSTSLPSSDVVRLSYNNLLPSDQYTLTVNDVDDANGNTIDPNSTASFTIFGDFAVGDVIINEFMYDPPGGQEEYVEIKNTSGKLLNLQGWQIGDNTGNGTISSDQVILQPNGFIAVSSDTSALFAVYGSRPYVQSSSIPSFNNNGDAVTIITDTGTQADSLQYDDSWGGDNVALERRSDTAPSIFQENFGDSPNPNGGTPGIANEVPDDTTPPDLDDLIITDDQTLDLDFTERLANGPAGNTANYSLDNGISINNAQQTAGDSVQLSLDSPLQNGTEYQLTVSNQEDIFGNTAAEIDTTFSFFVVTPADSGDIFINEFLYDPPSGSSEYIELKNPTSESFDLNGWTINDNSGNPQTITNNQFIVPPDSFVVLAPDQSLRQDNPDIALVDMGSSFPGLNNNGDDIVLRDDTGERLDSLQYESDWGGSQVALERRTTDVAPIQANFSDAPNGVGTPGRENDIGQDTTPPGIEAFTILDNQNLEFVFTEQVEQQSAENTANYTLSGGITINSATLAGGDTVNVSLSSALQNNTEYTATVDGVNDLFGNTLTNRDTTFTYFEVSPADSGDIFINEFTYDPPEGSTEYIEFYNTSSKSLDLQNWTISDNRNDPRTITQSQFIVPPDSFVVIAPDQTLLQNNPNIALVTMGTSFPSLNNSGDNIVLRDDTGERLDSLQYESDWGGSQVALERRTTDVEPIQANFGDAPNGFGTPGRENDIGQDTTPPDLADFAIANNQTLELAFTEALDNNTAGNAGNYALDNGISISNAQQTAGDSVRLSLSSPLQNATEYQLNITNQQDLFGNTAASIDTSFTYFEVSAADSGDIFINEFTYSPPEGSTEYIELVNPTSQSFDLSGWTISDNTGNQRVITQDRFIVPPDSFVVLAPDQTLSQNNPGINLVTMSGNFPSLNNGGDDIILRDDTGERLDSLRYNSSWGGDQIALERRTTDVAPIQANFGDAPNGFGTPGRENEIDQDNTPPEISAVDILGRQTLNIAFSEAVSSANATDSDNYTIDNGIAINSVQQTAEDSVQLTLDSPLENGVTYQLTATNQQDIFGNTNPSTSESFQFTDDTTPPELDNVTIVDNQTLDLNFSEQLASGPAEDETNYSIDNGIAVNGAQQTAGDSVRLSLDSPLQNGATYQLTVRNQQDIFGNTAGDLTETFSFFNTTPADSGDVFINEFTYDPPEGSTEYIELVNTTDESFDLNGWTINDNRGTRQTITDSQFIVPPDSFVVIAPDQTLLQDNPDIALVAMGTNFPSLNNSGDDIVLRDDSGERLDSLQYQNDWGGDGVALERRTTDVAPIQANFGDAPNGFGTPGRQNQIGQDNTPPDIEAFSILDNQNLEFVFTEQVEQQSAENVANYSINGGISINSAALSGGDTVQVNLSGSLQDNTTYTATVDGVQDLFGNTLASRNTTFTFFETVAADSGDIFINEFTYDPPEGSTEYIELFNTSSSSLDLRNWTINDNTGTLRTITESQFIVPPDSYVVLAPDNTLQDSLPNINLVPMGNRFPSLNNSGDDIVLRDDTGERLDSLQYTPAFGGDNIAVERRTIDAPPVEANFGDAPNGFGSPGDPNQIGQDNTPPELVNISIPDNQTLTLTFTEGLDEDPATATGNYTLNNGISVTNAQLTNTNSVRLSLDPALQNAVEYQLTITNQQDIFGNTTGDIDTTFTFFEASEADPGDLFINEFTYDPPEGSTEYVELFNPTTQSFDLSGWTINDNSGNLNTISDEQFIVPPDSYVVLAPDNTLQENRPNINLVTMGSGFPSLNNSGDDIVIRRADGTRLDSLTYTTAFGGNNVAVERRTIQAPPVAANFGDAPNGFGTPGQQNEISDDETPPTIEAFSIRNNQLLEFVFSEEVEEQSAENTANYNLTGGVDISSSTLFGGDTVRVSLSGQLQNNTSYTATVDGVQDLFGNTLTNRDTTFTFFETSPADPGDIFINEFTYDPPEGSTEYVELFNPTDESFDLDGWTINDNTGSRQTITDGQFIIPPNSFAVLAPDETLLNNNPDISLVDMGSRFPSLNNSGDDIVLRNANGTRLDSLRYNSDFGGNNIAVERRTIDAPPVASNFGDAPNGFGTPGATNGIGQDNTPPDLIGLIIPDNQTLRLAFSEGLANAPATDTNNYSLNNGIGVNSVQQVTADSVRLNLDSPLQNSTEYQLSVENQQDIFGNTAAVIDTSFTFFEISGADPDDIFINEFTADPPSGSTEYVELINTSSQSFDLNGWTINDNTGNRQTITNSRVVVPPNSYVVLAPDQTLLNDFPDINLVMLGSRFPSLNNSGDDIVIRNASGTRLDSLTYTPAFGGNNIAVERRTTDAPPVQANFGDAPNGFGTPGSPNEIAPDNTPPVLNSLRILDSTTFRLIFSEAITGPTATQESNYSINPNPGIQLISSVEDTVNLFLSQELQSEQSYEVTITGLQDVFGNTIAETSPEATFISFTDPEPGSIIINEFLYNRAGAGGAEFVELFNPTDQNFDLSGWTIGDASNTATIDDGVQLRAGGYLVITDNPSLANITDNAVFLSNFPSLNDDEDAIYIQDENAVTIDSLFYSPRFGGTIDGTSAERKDPQASSNDPANFATSTDPDGSTPGEQNSVFQRDETPPSITFARVFPNGDIEVRFSEFITLTSDLAFTLNDQPLNIISFDPTEGNVIFLAPPAAKTNAEAQNITAQNLTDVSGNTAETLQQAVAQPLTPGDVVINEILYDPISDSDDNRPDQNEYIELRNTRDFAINLEGITLHDAPDEDGDVRTLRPVSTQSRFIPAQGTALIYADEAFEFQQSQIAEFFELQPQPDNEIIRVDRSSLSLSSTDDAIYLTGRNGAEIDSVFYDESWQNPNLVDTDGIALERIDPDGPSNEESNWGSSTAESGGTPNQQNTLFQTSQGQAPDEQGITLTPNPFSPDGEPSPSGENDETLFINYNLDQPDYLITVRIYDRYGREVRELADSQPAGFQDELRWDGLKDSGDRNRIGIYIVIFKAFDSASGNNVAFKETVVLARRLN